MAVYTPKHKPRLFKDASIKDVRKILLHYDKNGSEHKLFYDETCTEPVYVEDLKTFLQYVDLSVMDSNDPSIIYSIVEIDDAGVTMLNNDTTSDSVPFTAVTIEASGDSSVSRIDRLYKMASGKFVGKFVLYATDLAGTFFNKISRSSKTGFETVSNRLIHDIDYSSDFVIVKPYTDKDGKKHTSFLSPIASHPDSVNAIFGVLDVDNLATEPLSFSIVQCYGKDDSELSESDSEGFKKLPNYGNVSYQEAFDHFASRHVFTYDDAGILRYTTMDVEDMGFDKIVDAFLSGGTVICEQTESKEILYHPLTLDVEEETGDWNFICMDSLKVYKFGMARKTELLDLNIK